MIQLTNDIDTTADGCISQDEFANYLLIKLPNQCVLTKEVGWCVADQPIQSPHFPSNVGVEFSTTTPTLLLLTGLYNA